MAPQKLNCTRTNVYDNFQENRQLTYNKDNEIAAKRFVSQTISVFKIHSTLLRIYCVSTNTVNTNATWIPLK